jgi:acetylornithine deacetylase
VPYWADSAFIAAAGIPTVLFGAGGTGAHAAEEWVDVASAVSALRILLAVTRELCG